MKELTSKRFPDRIQVVDDDTWMMMPEEWKRRFNAREIEPMKLKPPRVIKPDEIKTKSK